MHNDETAPPPASSTRPRRILVWDLPTRLFHWILVGSVATSLVAEQLGNMSTHVISGHVVLALVLFRIVWGVVGGRHARFTDFIKGPAAIKAYVAGLLKGQVPQHLGHNPLGGLSVLALLGVLSVQAVTGLFSNDDILTEGPLAKLVGKEMSDTITGWHDLSSDVLYVLIGLHLAAIAFYTVKGHELIAAMIGGEKTDAPGPQSPDARGNWILAVLLAAFVAAVAYFIKTY